MFDGVRTLVHDYRNESLNLIIVCRLQGLTAGVFHKALQYSYIEQAHGMHTRWRQLTIQKRSLILRKLGEDNIGLFLQYNLFALRHYILFGNK